MTDTKEKIEEISQRVLSELETATSDDLLATSYAKKMLLLSNFKHTTNMLVEIQNAPPRKKSDVEKKAVIKELLYFIWLQRLYFIIRLSIMGVLSTVITLIIVSLLGTINVYEAFVLGVFVFGVSLVITRLFDVQIINITKSIVDRLATHKALKDFVMTRF